jgi:hypothetical protein
MPMADMAVEVASLFMSCRFNVGKKLCAKEFLCQRLCQCV